MPECEPSHSYVTPNVAASVLRADADAILEQARAGKPLTRQQRAYLLSIAGGGDASASTNAGNYEELANLLGVSARALRDWRKMDGAPVRALDGSAHDVVAWRAFVKARGLKDNAANEGGEDADADSLPAESILKRRKMWADVQAREYELAIKRREFISIELVREHWQACVAQAVAILRKKLEDELPPILVGMEALEIRKECGEVIDAFVEQMHTGEGSQAGDE